MARRSLTQLAVDRLRPPATGRLEYWDTHLSGFGLRISASGAKSWMVMYRLRGERKQRRQTLGSLAEIPSVADARARALKSLEAARLGVDLREAVGMIDGEGIEGTPERGTLAAVAARFVREHADQHCRASTAAEYRRIFDREIIPHWGALPAARIAKRDVNALLDAKAQAYPLQANELRKHLRTFFRWAKDEELVDVDPTEGTRLRAKPIARDRVLSDAEIAWFWKACDELDRRLWVIPAHRAKNGKAHEVHLCEPAARILERLPRLGEIVFSSTGTTAPSGYSRAKSRLDRLMAGYAAGVRVADWTLHDLRRTATSGMARLCVAPHIVDKILNHSGGTIRGVAAVYNRHQYSQERKAALELWGAYIEKLINPSVGLMRGAAD